MAAKKKTTKKKTTKKKTVTKNKGGRPSKFTPEKIEFMTYLYESGKTDKQVAEIIGVDEHTIYNWRKKYPEFFQSLKDWKIQADEQVEISLYQRASGYTIKEEKVFCDAKTGMITTKVVDKYYPPDPTSMIFWLKNRHADRWRDKQEIDLGNKDGEEFNFSFDLIKKPTHRE